MSSEQHDPTSPPRQIIGPADILRMLDLQRLGKEDEAVEILERIRTEEGIGWAIYASAFMGRPADRWRVDVCEAMR